MDSGSLRGGSSGRRTDRTAEILKIDPNDFDLDPVEFVEVLERRYGVDFGGDFPGTG